MTGTCVLLACGDAGKTQPDAKTPDAPPAVDAAAPDADPYALTAAEMAQVAILSPLPAIPPDTTNAYADNPKAAGLGQMLFFDKSYSGALTVGDDGTNGGLGVAGDTGKVSCHSCHGVGSQDLDDQRSKPNNVSLGVDYGPRNALGLVNSAYYKWSNWGGKFDSQWSLPLAVAESAKLMKGTRLQVAHMLWTKYRAEYNAVFPVALDPSLDPAAADASRFPAAGKPGDAAWTAMAQADQDIATRIFVNYGKALAAYTRKLTSGNSPFDRFVAGDHTALGHAAIRGLKLFLAKGCIGCHSGPTFSDNKFHALAVPQTGAHVPAADTGRFGDVPALLASPFNTSGVYSDDVNTGKLTGLAQDASQTGQFRTKSLRNVGMSGPFMHAGQLGTLTEVVQFYSQGGGDAAAVGVTKDPLIVPLNLSQQEVSDLAEFLLTLTGDVMPGQLLADTSK